MVICIDFDGTCVTNEYPNIGKALPNCVEVLKKLNEKGVDLILLTQRAGKELIDAVEWFREKNIKLYSVNDNPSQNEWSQSRKVYANLYIDDRAIGCPLASGTVDWGEVEKILREMGIL